MPLSPVSSASTRRQGGESKYRTRASPHHLREASIVSIFMGESTRPSFGLEIWWRQPMSLSFQHANFFFNLPTDRKSQLQHVLRAMGAGSRKLVHFHRYPTELLEPLKKIQALRGTRLPAPRAGDLSGGHGARARARKERRGSLKKQSSEAPSTYLVCRSQYVLPCRSTKGSWKTWRSPFANIVLSDW